MFSDVPYFDDVPVEYAILRREVFDGLSIRFRSEIFRQGYSVFDENEELVLLKR